MPYRYECRGCKKQQDTEWAGPCPNCGGRYNMTKRTVDDGGDDAPAIFGQMTALADVPTPNVNKAKTGIEGFDFVIGGGIEDEQIIMICGEPGAGKSTLLLQVANAVARTREDVLYVAGEESSKQIKLRANRLGLKLSRRLQILPEDDLDAVIDAIVELHPKLVIIDSVQSFGAEDWRAGSIPAIRIVGKELAKIAHAEKIAFILVVQVTKDGGMAGPKAIEHDCDTALEIKNGDGTMRRLMCPTKNRCGAAPVEALFDMTAVGLIDHSSEAARSARVAMATTAAIPIRGETPTPAADSFWTLPPVTEIGTARKKGKTRPSVERGR